MVVSFRIDMDYNSHTKCKMTSSSPINYVESLSGDVLSKDSLFAKILDAE